RRSGAPRGPATSDGPACARSTGAGTSGSSTAWSRWKPREGRGADSTSRYGRAARGLGGWRQRRQPSAERGSAAREPKAARDVRVAVLSPVWFPVPPSGYGGIEWIVSLLADGLVDAGHDVTLFASGDSRT